MGDDRYKLIDVDQGKLPDVWSHILSFFLCFPLALICFVIQEVDILTLVGYVNGTDKNCAEALTELSLALVEGFCSIL